MWRHAGLPRESHPRELIAVGAGATRDDIWDSAGAGELGLGIEPHREPTAATAAAAAAVAAAARFGHVRSSGYARVRPAVTAADIRAELDAVGRCRLKSIAIHVECAWFQRYKIPVPSSNMMYRMTTALNCNFNFNFNLRRYFVVRYERDYHSSVAKQANERIAVLEQTHTSTHEEFLAAQLALEHSVAEMAARVDVTIAAAVSRAADVVGRLLEKTSPPTLIRRTESARL